MIFFTADTHFGHKNVITYAKRPFKHVDEMDEAMVANWNARVTDNDDVYHLGDVALCKPDRALWLLRRLNGRKHLVFGNHDKGLRKNKDFLDRFVWARDLTEIKVEDADAHDGVQRIVLCHYAMRVWNKSHYGAWQLFGHSHGSLADDRHSLSIDVGVDNWGYTPIGYATVKKEMVKKVWRSIDHHGRED